MKTRKSIISAILTICLIIALAVSAFAKEVTYTDKYGRNIVFGEDEFSVTYNGEVVVFPDAQPYVNADNRTLVPLRFVSEKMGGSVNWNGITRTVTVTKGNIPVTVTIGQSSIEVAKDGMKTTIVMDTQAELKEGRTFVPVIYVGKALGAWVGYSDLFNTAQIYNDVLTPEEITRLQGYADSSWQEYLDSIGSTQTTTEKEWIDSKPWIQHFTGTGTYGFENANEWLLRNPNDMAAFKGAITGGTWAKGVNTDVDLAKLIVREAVKGVEKQFKTDGLVEATLRTDLSGVFFSRHSSIGTAYVRGVLMMTVPEGADVSAIQSKYGISGVKAGEGYTGDVEVCVRVDPTNGYVYCTNLASLK